MKEEILKLIEEYLAYVDAHNLKHRNQEIADFEDDVEPTFYNFYKWLLWTINNQ